MTSEDPPDKGLDSEPTGTGPTDTAPADAAPADAGLTDAAPADAGLTEKLFRVAIAVKGLDAILQMLAGLLLAFVPSTVVTELAHQVITRDLIGDPSGKLAAHLQTAAAQFAEGSTRWFAIVYLLLHGLIKIGLVIALWRKIMPAYPIATVLLGAFVVYELLRAAHTHSIVLPIFAAIDIVIIVLVIREYLQLRREHRARDTTVGCSSSAANPGRAAPNSRQPPGGSAEPPGGW